MRTREVSKRCQRGGVLISALVFTVVISMLLAGMGSLAVSHYALALSDSDYSNAFYLAEGGVNFEFRKISRLSSSADPIGSSNGVTYNLGHGTFTVYATNRDGTTWTPGNLLYIVSKGTVNGISRTVKVSGKPYANSVANNYAVYGINSVSKDGNSVITGDLGGNGSIDMSGNNTVTGRVYANGPSARWSASGPSSSNAVVYGPTPIVWPTVETIANSSFSGGLNYLASHNDNSLASIDDHKGNATPITLNISTSGSGTINFYGKSGGANYYLSSISMSGNWDLNFDNTNGPINLWFGPSGSSGGISMSGGKSFDSPVSDPTKAVKIYVATTGGFNLSGGSEVDCSIYAYNNSNTGSVSVSGNGLFNGAIVARDVSMSGTQTVNAAGTFNNIGNTYYGYDESFVEQNSL